MSEGAGAGLWPFLIHKMNWPFFIHKMNEYIGCPTLSTSFKFQVNSWCPIVTTRSHKFKSALVQVLACCWYAPSHYLKPMLTSHQQGPMTTTVNSLWPSHYLNQCCYVDFLCFSVAIGRHKFRSALVQALACCWCAPGHYRNQCWLVISKVQWQSPKNYPSQMQSRFPKDQWVNTGWINAGGLPGWLHCQLQVIGKRKMNK